MSSFRMVIDDTFLIKDRGPIICGKVQSGILQVGDEIEIVTKGGQHITTSVAEIESFHKKINKAGPGQMIAIFLANRDINRNLLDSCHKGLVLEAGAASALPVEPGSSEQAIKAQSDFICDICGNDFDRATLDAHFAKTAQEAATINGVIWSGRLVTFDAAGKAWCPHCFKDAGAMRSGRRTVHEGKRTVYLCAPSLEIAYKCKCGRGKSFHCQSVNIYTGLESICADCGAILWVPPAIFDHLKPSQPREASLCSNYRDLMIFVEFRKSELDRQSKEGLITEQQHREELKRRGI